MGLFGESFESTFIVNDKCYLGHIVPGKNIEKSLGLISLVTKGVNGNINKIYNDLLKQFVQKLESIGGNAVINLRFETGSYQQQGSGWVTSYILIYGEAVIAS